MFTFETYMYVFVHCVHLLVKELPLFGYYQDEALREMLQKDIIAVCLDAYLLITWFTVNRSHEYEEGNKLYEVFAFTTSFGKIPFTFLNILLNFERLEYPRS